MKSSKCVSFVLATMLCSGLASADHHGRGPESTQGIPGVYVADRVTITFTVDGHLIVVANHSKVAVSVSEYTVGDNVLTLRDISAPAFIPIEAQECAKSNSGKYALVEEGDEIIWNLVDDACAARVQLYDGFAMRPYKRPEEAE